jgi:hypothetical protein
MEREAGGQRHEVVSCPGPESSHVIYIMTDGHAAHAIGAYGAAGEPVDVAYQARLGHRGARWKERDTDWRSAGAVEVSAIHAGSAPPQPTEEDMELDREMEYLIEPEEALGWGGTIE